MAAVEDHEKGACWWQAGDEVFVERVAGDLARGGEVDGADCVEDAGWVSACWIADLAAVAAVVEEVDGAWFAD